MGRNHIDARRRLSGAAARTGEKKNIRKIVCNIKWHRGVC